MPNSGVILSQGKVLYYQKITKAKNDTLIAPEWFLLDWYNDLFIY